MRWTWRGKVTNIGNKAPNVLEYSAAVRQLILVMKDGDLLY